MRNHDSTASFLHNAFVILKKEAPLTHRRIVAVLDRVIANIGVDDEKFWLTVANRDIKISTGWSKSAKAEGEITTQGLLQLVDAVTTVSNLLSSDALRVRADSETLLKLDTAIKLFLSASLRSTELQNQFEKYRHWALQRSQN